MPDDATPMTDADTTPPPASTGFEPAAPLKDSGVDFQPEGGTIDNGDAPAAGTTQSVRDGAARLTQQAGDRARSLVEDGKARAGGALDQLSQMLTDAAGQVDDKLGAQYGQYARTAAEAVSDFSGKLQARDIDDLLEEARGFVRKSPGVAIGAAAAIGFVLARLVSSGIDQRDA